MASHLLTVTTSAWIGCRAVLVVSLLVGLLAAVTGNAFLSEETPLMGDLLPNKDSSTWLSFPTVRYLRATHALSVPWLTANRPAQASSSYGLLPAAYAQASDTYEERTDLRLS